MTTPYPLSSGMGPLVFELEEDLDLEDLCPPIARVPEAAPAEPVTAPPRLPRRMSCRPCPRRTPRSFPPS